MPLAMVSPERHGSLEAFASAKSNSAFLQQTKAQRALHLEILWHFILYQKIAIDGLIVQAEILMFVNCQILEGIHLEADNSANVQTVLTG